MRRLSQVKGTADQAKPEYWPSIAYPYESDGINRLLCLIHGKGHPPTRIAIVLRLKHVPAPRHDSQATSHAAQERHAADKNVRRVLVPWVRPPRGRGTAPLDGERDGKRPPRVAARRARRASSASTSAWKYAGSNTGTWMSMRSRWVCASPRRNSATGMASDTPPIWSSVYTRKRTEAELQCEVFEGVGGCVYQALLEIERGGETPWHLERACAQHYRGLHGPCHAS
ncbi:hypothetical protein SCP_1403430 [Sparassis crispa]|uniref:Uncharacterized protein n=1 Tax=Sparassis crispa TaxID=139825 RepID=A0A401H3B7_9APHY|nr:hypothetical protein SCP_1403430 [Sparassis crispa]GBE88935.1 hypothetical protein SCP_1403430 [Sparassis crispa]